jgi:D-alanyl-D-alanine carboxypeptidase
VRTLSGYLKAKDGNHYAFSILMNGLPEGDAQAKVLQERIVRAIDTQSTAVAAGE